MTEDKKPVLPGWWLDGSGPLAIGSTASLIAAAIAWSRYGQPPPDGLGTLLLISLMANFVALDNCRDCTARRRGVLACLGIGSVVLALIVVAIAYRVPGSAGGLAR